MAEPLKLAVLVSGQGTNLRALLEAIEHGRCCARVCAVVSDRAQARALELAAARAIPSAVVSPRAHLDRAEWDRALAAQLAQFAPDLVVLAGFMRIVGSALLERFGGRILNVHPALLPAFPGIDAPAQALRAGVRVSGCTVHLVDAGVDTGPVLAQAAVPVHAGDDPTTLHARIQRAEHALLPAVIHAIALGDLRLGAAPAYVGAADSEERMLVSPPVL